MKDMKVTIEGRDDGEIKRLFENVTDISASHIDGFVCIQTDVKNYIVSVSIKEMFVIDKRPEA